MNEHDPKQVDDATGEAPPNVENNRPAMNGLFVHAVPKDGGYDIGVEPVGDIRPTEIREILLRAYIGVSESMKLPSGL